MQERKPGTLPGVAEKTAVLIPHCLVRMAMPAVFCSRPLALCNSHSGMSQAGDTLYTASMKPILTFLEDTGPGVHDTTAAACSYGMYELYLGKVGALLPSFLGSGVAAGPWVLVRLHGDWSAGAAVSAAQQLQACSWCHDGRPLHLSLTSLSAHARPAEAALLLLPTRRRRPRSTTAAPTTCTTRSASWATGWRRTTGPTTTRPRPSTCGCPPWTRPMSPGSCEGACHLAFAPLRLGLKLCLHEACLRGPVLALWPGAEARLHCSAPRSAGHACTQAPMRVPDG